MKLSRRDLLKTLVVAPVLAMLPKKKYPLVIYQSPGWTKKDDDRCDEWEAYTKFTPPPLGDKERRELIEKLRKAYKETKFEGLEGRILGGVAQW